MLLCHLKKESTLGRRSVKRQPADRWSRATSPFLRVAVTAGLLTGVVLTVGTTLSPPSGAAGNSALDAMITVQPGDQFQPVAASTINPEILLQQQALSNALNGESAEIAKQAWSSSDGSLFGVTLVKWPTNVINLNSQVNAVAENECLATTGNNPQSTSSMSNIGGSIVETCSGGSGLFTNGTVVVALKGYVMEMIESYGPSAPPTSQMEAFATTQYNALPAAPLLTREQIVGLVILFVLLILIGVVVAILVRRFGRKGRQRRAVRHGYAASGQGGTRRGAPPARAPGWYRDPNEPTVINYWDGPRVTARRRYSGGPLPAPPEGSPVPRNPGGAGTSGSPSSARSPGWYRDPNDPGIANYWDGSRVTARRRQGAQ